MNEISRYDYELPRELIAQYPLRRRSDARLMVVDRKTGRIDHLHVRDLPELLSAGDSLVLNETRVLPARLVGHRRGTGGRWQGLFLSADENGNWQVLCKTRGKLLPGERIVLEDEAARADFELELLVKLPGGGWACRPSLPGAVADLLARVGRVPLPPYIRHGEMEPGDREAYQTVYAEQPGAVAAPTAGLHFTERLLEEVRSGGTDIRRVTLHVGPGTFRPISAKSLSEHPMHEEWGRIDEQTVRRLTERRAAGGRIVAVGTTSVRVLETASSSGSLMPWQGVTDLFIRPPYWFRSVDALMTNFHLPRSTLLVLVHCFGGGELMRQAYATAIEQRYRFYSYGDAMLVI